MTHSVGSEVPFEGHHTSGPKRLLEPSLPLEKRDLLKPSLAKQRSKNQRAERDCQNARLSREDALIKRQSGIAENADGKSCCRDDGDGADERCCSGDTRRQARREPNEQRAQRDSSQPEGPRLIWQEHQECAQDTYHCECQSTFCPFPRRRHVTHQ